MVGTSNSPPSAAVTIEIGTRQCRSAPSRWKNACGGERQENIEIARRAAAHAGFALAGEPDAGAVLDALRDVDRQRALAGDAARSRVQARAGIVDHLAAALAGRAGALQREEALRVADAAGAAAGRAGLRLGAGLGAEPEQASQVTEVGMRISAVLPRERILQRDLHVVAQVGAALAAAGAALRRRPCRKCRRRYRRRPSRNRCRSRAAAAHALLEGGMAEAVIGGALVAVLQDVIGLVDFLEVELAVLVAGIAIGMLLHRQLAEGGLQLGSSCGALDLEHFVVISAWRTSALSPERHGAESSMSSPPCGQLSETASHSGSSSPARHG